MATYLTTSTMIFDDTTPTARPRSVAAGKPLKIYDLRQAAARPRERRVQRQRRPPGLDREVHRRAPSAALPVRLARHGRRRAPAGGNYALEVATKSTSAAARSRRHARARDRPPVVRRRDRPGELARDLVQRGLGDLVGWNWWAEGQRRHDSSKHLGDSTLLQQRPTNWTNPPGDLGEAGGPVHNKPVYPRRRTCRGLPPDRRRRGLLGLPRRWSTSTRTQRTAQFIGAGQAGRGDKARFVPGPRRPARHVLPAVAVRVDQADADATTSSGDVRRPAVGVGPSRDARAVARHAAVVRRLRPRRRPHLPDLDLANVISTAGDATLISTEKGGRSSPQRRVLAERSRCR